jgi:hypothetical protein
MLIANTLFPTVPWSQKVCRYWFSAWHSKAGEICYDVQWSDSVDTMYGSQPHHATAASWCYSQIHKCCYGMHVIIRFNSFLESSMKSCQGLNGPSPGLGMISYQQCKIISWMLLISLEQNFEIKELGNWKIVILHKVEVFCLNIICIHWKFSLLLKWSVGLGWDLNACLQVKEFRCIRCNVAWMVDWWLIYLDS